MSTQHLQQGPLLCVTPDCGKPSLTPEHRSSLVRWGHMAQLPTIFPQNGVYLCVIPSQAKVKLEEFFVKGAFKLVLWAFKKSSYKKSSSLKHMHKHFSLKKKKTNSFLSQSKLYLAEMPSLTAQGLQRHRAVYFARFKPQRHQVRVFTSNTKTI